ncbi:MAG: hypothetical protein INH41_01950 [Myxococcaceae bacterium]|nr:hypothetical protein [Myxococcaceae bacterium]MCA3011141.1 hypothetical protein [Myxococcaceae bacterium]
MSRLILAVALLVLPGCNAVVRGARLSSVPQGTERMFLSTGTAPRKFRTLGFLQVRGYGQEWAGYGDIGDAQLSGTIHRALADEAARMGGQGVINIEFLDENPSTDVERAQRAFNAVTSVLSGNGQLEAKERYVTVTGEVIVFLE